MTNSLDFDDSQRFHCVTGAYCYIPGFGRPTECFLLWKGNRKSKESWECIWFRGHRNWTNNRIFIQASLTDNRYYWPYVEMLGKLFNNATLLGTRQWLNGPHFFSLIPITTTVSQQNKSETWGVFDGEFPYIVEQTYKICTDGSIVS